MAGPKWNYRDLKQMDYADYLNIFEDIPSGEESKGDLEADDVDDIDAQNLQEDQIILEDIIDVVDMNDGNNDSTSCDNDDCEFSAEDNIPLSQCQHLENSGIFPKIVGLATYQRMQPVDIFLCLFPNALFEHIVYETNLYATQASAHTGCLLYLGLLEQHQRPHVEEDQLVKYPSTDSNTGSPRKNEIKPPTCQLIQVLEDVHYVALRQSNTELDGPTQHVVLDYASIKKNCFMKYNSKNY
ncbi:hypothetical protein NQ314_016024 [Rhamnusium bicolor]|uniref:Uncharacterized protein n=1 Tax=Rhamnusium bicolor TaxID=1586634 RepID=A0AAV8WXZ1_9CUCU|nr:hypothetical protein NQ314_016024 [Rhamnusium bicolor]